MNRFVNFNNSSLSSSSGIEGAPGFMTNIKNMTGGMGKGTLIGMAVVIILAVGLCVYLFYYLPTLNSHYKPNSEHIPVNSKAPNAEAEVLFFYTDWCPHCKTAKPVWNDIKSQYENKTINGYKVIFTEINCTEESAEVEQMMNQYSVEGFPTIKLLKDGQVIEYDAKPSKETMDQFLNTVL